VHQAAEGSLELKTELINSDGTQGELKFHIWFTREAAGEGLCFQSGAFPKRRQSILR
jgi:hypothetical protein